MSLEKPIQNTYQFNDLFIFSQIFCHYFFNIHGVLIKEITASRIMLI
jgi:hypothetical protein